MTGGKKPRRTEEEVIAYLDTMSNWGRWGADDELGALNLIGPEKVREATQLVHEGLTVSCSRVIEWAPKPTMPEAAIPPVHFMQRSGESAAAEAMDSAYDWAGLPLHGLYVTHIDAFSHVFWKGRMYNGRPASDVVGDRGARSGSIDLANRGIATRGVLLDIPRVRGTKWLEDGDGVDGEDLEAAERLAGVEVQPGDAMFVRTGYGARRPGSSPDMPGLNADSLEFIHARQPAVIATDTGTDAHPSGYASMPGPVHCVCMVAMGIWLIDACDLEPLSLTTQELARSEFMAVVNPLRLKNSTGSPVNPLAIF